MNHKTKTGKVVKTCIGNGKTIKAFCKPTYDKQTGTVSFAWDTKLQCPGPGEAWAQWEEWASGNNSKCVPQKVTRNRLCNDGKHPGKPTECTNPPEGPNNETKIYWPKTCRKCHADMGMMLTPGTLNVPKLPLPSTLRDTEEDKYDDGFVLEGESIVKIACHDDTKYTKFEFLIKLTIKKVTMCTRG